MASSTTITREDDGPPDETRRSWAQEVADKMATLPESQATALRLVYNHELPYPEAAAWLGLTTSEVRAIVAEGLVRLGRLLQGDDAETVTSRVRRRWRSGRARGAARRHRQAGPFR